MIPSHAVWNNSPSHSGYLLKKLALILYFQTQDLYTIKKVYSHRKLTKGKAMNSHTTATGTITRPPSTVGRFLAMLLWNKKFSFSFAMITVCVWSFAKALTPYFTKLIVDGVTCHQGPSSQILSSIGVATMALIGVWAVTVVSLFIHDLVMAKAYPQSRAHTTKLLIAYVQHHSHTFFHRLPAGVAAKKIIDATRSLEDLLRPIFYYFAPMTLALILEAGVLWFAHPLFTIISIIWIIAVTPFSVMLAQWVLAASKKHNIAHNNLGGTIFDSLKNISTVRLFAEYAFEQSFIKKIQKKETSASQILEFRISATAFFYGVARVVLVATSLLVLIYTKQRNLVTAGDFAFVITATQTMVSLLERMGTRLVEFLKNWGVATESLREITDPYDLMDVPGAPDINITKGEICFKHVSFNYVADKNLFKNKNMIIHPGEKVGLVGYSGSGKTSFINLILRYFDVDEGQILIDGQDISKVTQDSLRNQISVIPQDSMLFNRTIMDNLRYGNPQASDRDVIKASKQAMCHDFIKENEEGYDFEVGEHGSRLSGGQRQRVAIARAILKNSKIIILDEATSALDSATELQILESFYQLMEGKTSLVIAHHLATLRNMDRILVFKEGKVIENGTHTELLKQKGFYSQLWNMQTNGTLPDKDQILDARKEQL